MVLLGECVMGETPGNCLLFLINWWSLDYLTGLGFMNHGWSGSEDVCLEGREGFSRHWVCFWKRLPCMSRMLLGRHIEQFCLSSGRVSSTGARQTKDGEIIQGTLTQRLAPDCQGLFLLSVLR